MLLPRYLQDKDIALDKSMIPLGSCTMKLNATSEMVPISWPEFSNMHPFAPVNQTEGYKNLISDLENYLIKITGFDAVSMQPNSGEPKVSMQVYWPSTTTINQRRKGNAMSA